MTARRRPVITGVGAVTPLGTDLLRVRQAILAGESAVRAVRSFDASSLPQPLGAETGELDFRSAFRIPKAMKVTDLRTRMAVLATASAISSARLDPASIAAERTGVIIGCSGSDMQVDALAGALDGDTNAGDDTVAFGRAILDGLNPLWLLVNLPNMVSAHVSIQFDARGPNNTVMTDWIAGLQSIAEGARLVCEGEADLVLAGGADVGVLPLVYVTFEQGGLFPAEGDDSSLVPANAAAVFVIEERAAAVARGATILAELEGDASCAWAESGTTLARSVELAVENAGWERAELVLLPSTGCTQLDNDALRLERALRDRQQEPVEIFETARVRDALGFSLAAAAVVDLCLALSDPARRRRRAVAASRGFMGQAAALSLTLFPEDS